MLTAAEWWLSTMASSLRIHDAHGTGYRGPGLAPGADVPWGEMRRIWRGRPWGAAGRADRVPVIEDRRRWRGMVDELMHAGTDAVVVVERSKARGSQPHGA
jgi:hypothetical protein